MLGTALAPAIGYDKAAAIAKAAAKDGRTIREVAREESGLSDEELDKLLRARGDDGTRPRQGRRWRRVACRPGERR